MSDTSAARLGVVVIVDDEPGIRTLFELVLERRGHTVSTAGSVPDALTTCAQRKPDVVMIDIFMPQGSGLELIRSLKAQHPSPKIIAITGGGTWGGVEILDRAKDAGADLTLRKPIASDALVEAVEGLLRAG